MADRRILVHVEKKYIDRLHNGKIWYRTAWMWDFTCPKFRKLETFAQVGQVSFVQKLMWSKFLHKNEHIKSKPRFRTY